MDYLRNDPTSTAVGPYSTRSRFGAPVAMPIEWEDLQKPLDPAAFNVKTAPAHIASVADPWAGIGKVQQRLPT
jgi:bifunctional non-homologous end joining protein LigD